MTVTNFTEFYLDELRDMYSAERQLMNALPRYAIAVSSDELRTALTRHVGHTGIQIDRLDTIFADLGASPSGHTCHAMTGLIKEADEVLKDVTPGLLQDSALIACLQKVEHYEMAGYDTLRIIAGHMVKPEHVSLLTASMAEEKAADAGLASLAQLYMKDAATEEVRRLTGTSHDPMGKPHQSLGRDPEQMARDRGVGQGLGLAEGRGQENDPHRVVVLDPEDLE
ncbi:MAG TPA: DUF892 family protein [Fimbriimonas sp.]|nr:DUF892 family protein [Fimbriimonas sp.]